MKTHPAGRESDPGSRAERLSQVPLCVDLDGTLVKTNTLIECMVSLIKTRPVALLYLPFWFLRGQAFLWSRLAPISRLNVGSLPIRAEVLELIRAEAEAGREVVLVTGAHESVAAGVAAHVGGFSRVLATSASGHLVGESKAKLLVDTFGAGGFDYIGDSRKDLPAWRQARTAIVVDGSAQVLRQLRQGSTPVFVLATKQQRARGLLRALRPHQWAKNLLVFVPLMLGHKLNDAELLTRAFWVFLATCVAGSGTYLINDLLDLEVDRLHPSKRNRPFASGEVPLTVGLLLGPALLIVAMAAAWMVDAGAALLLGGYLLLSTAYSIWLKRVLAVDVILLAGLYCIRLLIGGAVTDIALSPWTVAFSMFLFLSLALMKRYSELHNLKLGQKSERAAGRNYSVADMPVVSSLGAASGMTAVLVVALYVNGPDVTRTYGHPELLWMICVFILFWITRLWLIAGRGELDEDPVLFALKDPWSIALALVSGAALWIAL